MVGGAHSNADLENRPRPATLSDIGDRQSSQFPVVCLLTFVTKLLRAAPRRHALRHYPGASGPHRLGLFEPPRINSLDDQPETECQLE